VFSTLMASQLTIPGPLPAQHNTNSRIFPASHHRYLQTLSPAQHVHHLQIPLDHPQCLTHHLSRSPTCMPPTSSPILIHSQIPHLHSKPAIPAPFRPDPTTR